jgi:hypothetical protein
LNCSKTVPIVTKFSGRDGVTYPATPAKISTRRARVHSARHSEKITTYTITIPRRTRRLGTKYNMIIEESGRRQAIMVVTTSITARI